MIGARVLNISSQDYELQGSSVTILIADESKVPMGDTTVAHLDKSHITVHICPEYHPDTCLAAFRVDIDVNSMKCLDKLCHPVSVIREAEEMGNPEMREEGGCVLGNLHCQPHSVEG